VHGHASDRPAELLVAGRWISDEDAIVADAPREAVIVEEL